MCIWKLDAGEKSARRNNARHQTSGYRGRGLERRDPNYNQLGTEPNRTVPVIESGTNQKPNQNPPNLEANQYRGSRFLALAEVDLNRDMEGNGVEDNSNKEENIFIEANPCLAGQDEGDIRGVVMCCTGNRMSIDKENIPMMACNNPKENPQIAQQDEPIMANRHMNIEIRSTTRPLSVRLRPNQHMPAGGTQLDSTSASQLNIELVGFDGVGGEVPLCLSLIHI